MQKRLKKIWILVPCYNEGILLPKIYPEFVSKLHQMKQQNLIREDSVLLFIDDGSLDDTWTIIETITERTNDVYGLKLKKNVGQLHALLAGLLLAKDYGVDAAITIDCDGQDDIHKIPDMILEFYAGNDIVYGIRNNRASDTFLKRNTAMIYYFFMHLFDKSFLCNHSEFRLMSYRVLEYLDNHGEQMPFLRKICYALSYYEKLPSSCIYYTRRKRIDGKTNYSFFGLCKLAILSLRPTHHSIGHVSHDAQYQIEKLIGN